MIDQLLWQLFIGTIVMCVAIGVQTLFIGLALAVRPHLARRIGRPRLLPFVVLVAAVTLWLMLGQTVCVWMWASVLMYFDAFDALEPAIYYALASYTTLGFGDVLPPKEWRVLGTMIGANGMLGFGLVAAGLVQLVTVIRQDLGAPE